MNNKLSVTLPTPEGGFLTMTIGGNIEQLAKEDFDNILWQVPCQQGALHGRTYAELKKCQCIQCVAAGAALLKWRLMR